MSNKLSHLDEEGNIHMVDVSQKAVTERIATASSKVTFPAEIFESLRKSDFHTKKGSITQVAIIAGINAVKQCSNLIPLCHNIPISKAEIDINPDENAFIISCGVKTVSQTGVEMEALTGVSVAALCIYDMTKALSHDIIIGPTKLDMKSGGKRDFQRNN